MKTYILMLLTGTGIVKEEIQVNPDNPTQLKEIELKMINKYGTFVTIECNEKK